MKNIIDNLEQEQILKWSEAAKLMAAIDLIGKSGLTAVVKIDGGRVELPYTVLISGASLGEDFFRKDGGDINELLRAAIDFYDERKL